MASFTQYATKLLPLEGGYHYDNGKHSNRGITLETYRNWRLSKGIKTTTVDDVKKITITEAKQIYKVMYWDVLMADKIINQAVAEIGRR
jgi:lysozyme family protein